MAKTNKEYETRIMLDEERYFFIVTYYMNSYPNKQFLQNANYYFDTDDLYLRSQHMTLRVRVINDVKSELTLKIKCEDVNKVTLYSHTYNNVEFKSGHIIRVAAYIFSQSLAPSLDFSEWIEDSEILLE